MNTKISLLAEIPENLHCAITQYLECHPGWDQDRLFAAALSLFLLQNGEDEGRTAQVYMDNLFKQSV